MDDRPNAERWLDARRHEANQDTSTLKMIGNIAICLLVLGVLLYYITGSFAKKHTETDLTATELSEPSVK